MKTVLRLTPRAPFDFAGTAVSHGWIVLAPNAWDREHDTMTRTERLASGRVVLLRISGEGSTRKPGIRLEVTHRGRLARRDAQEIEARVRRMFRLEEDLRGFYSACRKRGGAWKKATAGWGRLLRSPGVFEDVVKIVCTTNVQWGGTRKMVEGLVDAFGEPCDQSAEVGYAKRAFPRPDAIAATDGDDFAARVRMGYRAPYIHELATRVAEGELDLEALNDPDIPTPVLKKRLLDIKGVGNYAAASLLMLLGRYDDLPMDTVCREFVKKKYLGGRTPSDSQIQDIYEEWGEWRFLAYWFDLWQGFDGEL